MKKLLLILFFGIFLLGSVSAWDYDSSYSYGSASAYAKVVGNYPECDGQKSGNYCVGNYYVDVSYTGDKFYMGYSYMSWSPSSNENGYTGIPSSNPGRKVLPVKDGHPQGYIICAWDYDLALNEDWAWTSQCGGYLRDTFQELNVVECYNDNDCGLSEFCSKNGGFQNWQCEQIQCPASCQSPTEWSQCSNGEMSRTNYNCDSSTGYQCESVVEKQACDCEVSNQCQYDESCESNLCVKLECEENEIADNNECIEDKSISPTLIIGILIGVVVLILIIIVIFVILKLKGGARKKYGKNKKRV